MEHLLVFYGEGCTGCAELFEHLKRLAEEEGVTVTTYEVWESAHNSDLMDQYDREGCGGVPFLYNKQSGRSICGAASYQEVRAWAHGQ